MPSALKTIFFSLVGMILGQLVVSHFVLGARDVFANAPQSLEAKEFVLVDGSGRRRILISQTPAGAPGIWLFDDKGRTRMNLGLYEDNNATIVLNDENEQAVEIFRTFGNHNAPVLVMKAKGQDRIVMGLNFGDKPDPFLVYYDEAGKKNTVFGRYE